MQSLSNLQDRYWNTLELKIDYYENICLGRENYRHNFLDVGKR